MRWLASLGSICVLVTLASCSGPSEYPELVERDGLWFQRGDSIPYTGTTITLHQNGQLSETKTYSSGMLHGPRLGFYENGQLEFLTYYTSGWGQGIDVSFHENGNLHHLAFNRDGLFVNEIEIYHPNGVLRLKGKYTENNEAIFPFQVYDESGLLIRELKTNSELLGQMISLL